MRPLKELIGKTIAEMPVEVLYDEIDERAAIRDAIGEENLFAIYDKGDIPDVQKEINTLLSEVDRLTMMPDSSGWRNEYNFMFWEFIEAGMEIQRKSGTQQRESKLFAVEHAAELFEKDPTVRLGEVVKSIRHELKEMDLPYPKPDKYGEERSGKRWLHEAEKKGLLHIPDSAIAGGADTK